MDLPSHKFFQASSVLVPHGESPIESNMSLYGKSKDNNPFVDAFPDPLCKLNLRETSEFVKSFPVSNGNAESRGFLEVSAQRREGGNDSVTQQRRLEAPPTPGRPVFSFSSGSLGRNLSRKGFPSKWDDAEKWLMSSSCHDSPAHNTVNMKVSESSRSAPDNVSILDPHNTVGVFNGVSCPTDIVLKDKFTDSIEPILPISDIQSQLKKGSCLGTQLETQYDIVTSNWSSSEEEEKEISKSLRHNSSQKADSDCIAATWEEEEKTKCCLRYQREEAKIQAWVNLQNAKAEAQSRKLEVKIQKMRANLEEKLMKRMSVVHRKAEEWRATARQQHLEQIQRAAEQAKKMNHRHTSQFSRHTSCGCFPCNNNHH
ncbi:Remorin, C-terminal [Sesbania bispinosa]|nr:Remorin, C-terminal [Sesbania bispinosa]